LQVKPADGRKNQKPVKGVILCLHNIKAAVTLMNLPRVTVGAEDGFRNYFVKINQPGSIKAPDQPAVIIKRTGSCFSGQEAKAGFRTQLLLTARTGSVPKSAGGETKLSKAGSSRGKKGRSPEIILNRNHWRPGSFSQSHSLVPRSCFYRYFFLIKSNQKSRAAKNSAEIYVGLAPQPLKAASQITLESGCQSLPRTSYSESIWLPTVRFFLCFPRTLQALLDFIAEFFEAQIPWVCFVRH
jgi:hypothetical protein